MTFFRPRLLIPAAAFCLCVSFLTVTVHRSPAYGQAQAQEDQTTVVEPNLTEDEMRQFMLTAKVIRAKDTAKGITRPKRLTMTDGKLTHDAIYQPIDVYKSVEKFADGTTELNFRDTYHYNIAAYELTKLLEIESMMPLTIEGKYKGKRGSMSWCVNAQMDEAERIQKKIRPPDPEAWNRQMYRKRVFAELVYDKDPNLTNVLIGPNWEIYMIDFSRAFRLHEDLAHPMDLVKCDRQLMERLRQLDAAEVERVTKDHLEKPRIKALMKRRDRMLAVFDQLIKEKGEAEVLY